MAEKLEALTIVGTMSASPSVSPHRNRSAILFADVHGYAQLMDRNEERTFERATRSIRLMKSLIGDYGGRVMNVAGDGVLALFESAPEALRFAVAVQQELRNEVVWASDDEVVAFRIGINLGEVLLDDETNIQGRSVNLAVRIALLAPPGGICLSLAVSDVMQATPGVILRSLGRQRLKNIAEPVEVFVVERETPALPAIAALPSQNQATAPQACLDRAVALAQEAVDRDDLDARGYAQLGYAYLFRKQQDASLAAYEEAIELNPNDADILADMAMSVRASGDTDRALHLATRAMRHNPFHPDAYLWVRGEIYFDLAAYEQAIHTLHRMRDKSEGHRLLAASYALIGQVDEAKYHAGHVMARHPNFSIEHWRNIPPDKNPQPLERFIDGLRMAGLR